MTEDRISGIMSRANKVAAFVKRLTSQGGVATNNEKLAVEFIEAIYALVEAVDENTEATDVNTEVTEELINLLKKTKRKKPDTPS